MIILGLTGSIGMGKSTTAGFFLEAGVPVWDADAAVHRLYTEDGAAVDAIAQLSPQAVTSQGVNRQYLKEWLNQNPDGIKAIEEIVHPLVRDDRERFIAHHRRLEAPLIVLDIPLLFETGADTQCDQTLVVSVDEEEQRRRVLERPGMTESAFAQLAARQMPDAQKRARADHVIETYDKHQARQAVLSLIQKLTNGHPRNATDRS